MAPASLHALLEDRLKRGAFFIGEIEVVPGIELRPRAGVFPDGLTEFDSPEAARHLAVYDSRGKYRPLKTAPNLRRDWRLRLQTVPELRLALDFFYPAALGTWLAFLRNHLPVTPLRETLARQTGMYRITQKISDAQAEILIAATCGPEMTLALALWGITKDQPHAFTRTREQVLSTFDENEIPILSAEAGNFIVAEARRIVKSHPGT